MNKNEFEYRNIKFIAKVSSKIFRRGSIYITEMLKPYGINYVQMMCLIALYIEDGIKQEAIIDDIGVDKASVNRAIKSLEEKKFITRERDTEDRRGIKLYLTKKALEFKEVNWEIISGWELILSDGITEEKKAIAFEVLEKMSRNADKFYKLEVDKDRRRDESTSKSVE